MKGTRKARAVAAGLFFAAAWPLLAGDGLWTSEGLPHTAVFSLALGQLPRTVFASTFYGALRSPLQGVWNAIPGTSQNAEPIAVDPSDPRILYAGAVRSYARQGHFCGGADTQAFAN